MKCDTCSSETNYRLRCEKGVWMCMGCLSKRYVQQESGYSIKENVLINGKMWVTKARLTELESRVCIPDHTEEGGYNVGRRLKNGKVLEQCPDYRP